MSFRDYAPTPADNTALGDGTYIGPNMLRNKVRPALQQIAADGRELYDEVVSRGAGGILPEFIQPGARAVAESVQAALRRLPLFPEQFGAAGDGVTNDAVALQDAITASASSKRPLVLTGVYLTAAQLSVPSYAQIEGGSATATIKTSTTNICILLAATQSHVQIRGIKFQQTVAGTAPYMGLVALTSCTDCIVENCEFVGAQWAGIYLSSSDRNTIRNNYFHNSLGSVNDSSDICIYRASSYNTITGNRCFSGNWHGIFLQDPYEGNLPSHNIVNGNLVTAHGCYGITVYIPGTGDTYNIVSNNTVWGITGAQPLDPVGFPAVLDAGAGIYVVGAGAGGTVVSGNIVRHCCLSTSGRSLAPGAIGVNGLAATNAPVTVTGNVVSEITRYDGINVSTCAGAPISVSGNSIYMPANSTGAPLWIQNAINVAIGANSINRTDGGQAIYVLASDSQVTNVTLSGTQIKGRVEFAVSGTGTFVGGSITGLAVSGVANGFVPLTLVKLDQFAVTGNLLKASNTYGLSVTNCTKTRISGNAITGGVSTGGTCTSSSFDKSNDVGGSAIDNTATGFLVQQYATAAPATGTGANGDRRSNSVATVGQPKGWRCTTAGAPGTWTSEGNL